MNEEAIEVVEKKKRTSKKRRKENRRKANEEVGDGGWGTEGNRKWGKSNAGCERL